MIEEIEKLKEALENRTNAIKDESMLSEWQSHPITKALRAELINIYLRSIEKISDAPTCEATRISHAAGFGSRDAITDILNSDYFYRGDDEE